jgi:hypothetical protein
MKITTETGSVYDIDDHGICVKTDMDGRRIDAFKPFIIIPVTEEVASLSDIVSLPHGDPVVGMRMYISGLDNWWLSTRVVSVE